MSNWFSENSSSHFACPLLGYNWKITKNVQCNGIISHNKGYFHQTKHLVVHYSVPETQMMYCASEWNPACPGTGVSKSAIGQNDTVDTLTFNEADKRIMLQHGWILFYNMQRFECF